MYTKKQITQEYINNSNRKFIILKQIKPSFKKRHDKNNLPQLTEIININASKDILCNLNDHNNLDDYTKKTLNEGYTNNIFEYIHNIRVNKDNTPNLVYRSNSLTSNKQKFKTNTLNDDYKDNNKYSNNLTQVNENGFLVRSKRGYSTNNNINEEKLNNSLLVYTNNQKDSKGDLVKNPKINNHKSFYLKEHDGANLSVFINTIDKTKYINTTQPKLKDYDDLDKLIIKKKIAFEPEELQNMMINDQDNNNNNNIQLSISDDGKNEDLGAAILQKTFDKHRVPSSDYIANSLLIKKSSTIQNFKYSTNFDTQKPDQDIHPEIQFKSKFQDKSRHLNDNNLNLPKTNHNNMIINESNHDSRSKLSNKVQFNNIKGIPILDLSEATIFNYQSFVNKTDISPQNLDSKDHLCSKRLIPKFLKQNHISKNQVLSDNLMPFVSKKNFPGLGEKLKFNRSSTVPKSRIIIDQLKNNYSQMICSEDRNNTNDIDLNQETILNDAIKVDSARLMDLLPKKALNSNNNSNNNNNNNKFKLSDLMKACQGKDEQENLNNRGGFDIQYDVYNVNNEKIAHDEENKKKYSNKLKRRAIYVQTIPKILQPPVY